MAAARSGQGADLSTQPVAGLSGFVACAGTWCQVWRHPGLCCRGGLPVLPAQQPLKARRVIAATSSSSLGLE